MESEASCNITTNTFHPLKFISQHCCIGAPSCIHHQHSALLLSTTDSPKGTRGGKPTELPLSWSVPCQGWGTGFSQGTETGNIPHFTPGNCPQTQPPAVPAGTMAQDGAGDKGTPQAVSSVRSESLLHSPAIAGEQRNAAWVSGWNRRWGSLPHETGGREPRGSWGQPGDGLGSSNPSHAVILSQAVCPGRQEVSAQPCILQSPRHSPCTPSTCQGQGTRGQLWVAQEGSPRAAAFPSRNRYSCSGKGKSVIHKNHRLYAEGDSSLLVRGMLNSPWHTELEKPELEKQSSTAGWDGQSSTPCPGGSPQLQRHPQGTAEAEGEGAARPGQKELLGCA